MHGLGAIDAEEDDITFPFKKLQGNLISSLGSGQLRRITY